MLFKPGPGVHAGSSCLKAAASDYCGSFLYKLSRNATAAQGIIYKSPFYIRNSVLFGKQDFSQKLSFLNAALFELQFRH